MQVQNVVYNLSWYSPKAQLLILLTKGCTQLLNNVLLLPYFEFVYFLEAVERIKKIVQFASPILVWWIGEYFSLGVDEKVSFFGCVEDVGFLLELYLDEVSAWFFSGLFEKLLFFLFYHWSMELVSFISSFFFDWMAELVTFILFVIAFLIQRRIILILFNLVLFPLLAHGNW